jgi:hypothetical protein
MRRIFVGLISFFAAAIDVLGLCRTRRVLSSSDILPPVVGERLSFSLKRSLLRPLGQPASFGAWSHGGSIDFLLCSPLLAHDLQEPRGWFRPTQGFGELQFWVFLLPWWLRSVEAAKHLHHDLFGR